jgi:gluconokinase
MKLSPKMKHCLVVMGVAGCGKSRLGQAVAQAEQVPMIEGDAFHSAQNLEKMSRGVGLTDADRRGWLDALAAELERHADGAVLSCSALRRRYRDRLREAAPGLRFVFLEIGREAALQRVSDRAGSHFFPAELVDSQLATLEPPLCEPGVLQLDATLPPEILQSRVHDWLRTEERA